MKRVAYITSEDLPDLIDDDLLAVALLKERGVAVEPLVWDRALLEPERFDALIFRSCWNYHQKYRDFLAFIERLEALGRPVFNSLALTKWNIDKSYLLELAAKGAALPKTRLLKVGETADPVDVAQSLGVESVVVKPTVSLNGHDTYCLSARENTAIRAAVESIGARDILIQEFVPEIKTYGETSLLFFNGVYSHAVRKFAAANEFRIHAEYGGTRAGFKASPALIGQAKSIVESIDEPLLFARVDLIERANGEAALVELEIVDPMLYLGYDAGAPARFADAVAERVSERR